MPSAELNVEYMNSLGNCEHHGIKCRSLCVFSRVRVYSFTKVSKGTQNRLSLEFLCTVRSNKLSNEHIPELDKYLLVGCIQKTTYSFSLFT